MNRTAGIVVGSIALGLLLVGLSYLWAQRGGPPDVRVLSGDVGRYQVVRATGDIIILLDTTTGDLYYANPKDIKPYNSRPHNGRVEEFKRPRVDKDEPPFDRKPPKEKDFKEKDVPKDLPKDYFKDRDKDSFKDGPKEKDFFKDKEK
jgi:hypothetical protein